MAFLLYKKYWAFDRIPPSSDPDEYVEIYTAETWELDTLTYQVRYRDGRASGQTYQRFIGNGFADPLPENEDVIGEVYGYCLPGTTTRRAYLHDGTGTLTPDDTSNSPACNFGQLSWERVQAFAPLPGQTTGRVQLDTTGGVAPLEYALTGVGPMRNGLLNADGWVEVNDLEPGAYLALIADASQPAQRLEQAFIIPAAAAVGCTDRSALNFSDDARFDDGSCLYTPPVRKAVFRVPRLNPLRFVIQQQADGCAVFETTDNTLFCEQTRPGQQLRPRYRQPVQYCDVVPLQVHTNFDAVSAELYRLIDGQMLRSQPLSLVQQHTGIAEPLPVILREWADGLTAVTAAGADPLPATLRRAARLTLAGAGGEGSYRIQEVAFDEAAQPVLVLSRPWSGAPGAGQTTARWALATVDFNVWELTDGLDFSGLAAGTYQVRLRATDAVEADAVAVSEPLQLAERHENTLVLDYGNADNCFGMVWATGIRPRLRVAGTFFRPRPAGTLNVHRSSSGVPALLSSTAQRQLVLETAGLPAWLHEQLFLLFRLDYLRVNGQPVLAPDAYEYTELRNFPLAAGTVTVELLGSAGFGVGNGDDSGLGAGAGSDDTLLELQLGGFLKLH